MEIRLRSTGEVMYEGEFRTRFVQNLPPTPLTQEWLNTYTSDPAGDILFEGPQATTVYPYEFSYRNGAVQDDQGRWFTKYSVGPVFADRPATETEPAKTAAEQMAEYKAGMDTEQARRIREDRNNRLNDSDWSQIGDSTADKTAWATYRQALRDIPTSAGFPWNVVWPDTP
jgi:hypothetical protein